MSGFPIVLVICLGSAILAMGGFMVLRKLLRPIDVQEHQQFLDAMFNIVGTLVSLILGLLVASALDHYQTLERSIDAEATSLSEIFRFSRGFNEPSRSRIQNLCESYCTQVLNDEWPAMEKGQVSPKVFETFCQLNDEIVLIKPAHDGESNLQAAMLESLDTIGTGRRERILTLKNTRTRILGPILLTGALIVLAFTYLYVNRLSVFHSIVIGCVAIALGGNLALVYLLSKPFEGDWKIQPTAFLLNLKAREQLRKSDMLDPAKYHMRNYPSEMQTPK
jgi:hypothetical protein